MSQQRVLTYSVFDGEVIEWLAHCQIAYNLTSSRGKAQEIACHAWKCATQNVPEHILIQVDNRVDEIAQEERELSDLSNQVSSFWRKHDKKPSVESFLQVVLYLANLEENKDEVFQALESGLGNLAWGKTKEQLKTALSLYKPAD